MFAAIILLLAAIGLEVAATSVLPRTHGFRSPGWSGVVVVGYALSAWLLALVVERMAVSTAYALWAGIGTAAVAFVGAVWLGESWDVWKVVALTLIVVGVVMLNLHGAH